MSVYIILQNLFAEEKVQAMTTLSRYLPDQSVDSLSKELRVENDPTVQKVRQDTEARENMRTLADPKSSAVQRADAAIGLANRRAEIGRASCRERV